MRKDLVILKPVVTEKTVAQPGKFTFIVNSGATKHDIMDAVKEFYGVEAVKVNVINTPLKTRTLGRGREITRRAEMKKATVTLAEGKTIDFNAFK